MKTLLQLTISPIEHWRRNLERFPPGSIGYEYAMEALAHLDPLHAARTRAKEKAASETNAGGPEVPALTRPQGEGSQEERQRE